MSSSSSIRLLAIILVIFLGVAAAFAREVVPAPENGGPGQTVLPEDNEGPYGTGPWIDTDNQLQMELARLISTGGKTYPLDTLGGDDIEITVREDITYLSLDIAESGDIYAAMAVQHLTDGWEIQVYRSADQGQHWTYWGRLARTGVSDQFMDPCIKVVEGLTSGVFVVYRRIDGGGDTEIRVSSSPLDRTNAAWSAAVTIMSQAGVSFEKPRFDTDADSFSNFYMYVVAEGDDGNGQDIWFGRSTDQGASFETPYELATLLPIDREYVNPDISYGYGNRLHATWQFRSRDDSFDSSVRYRRAASFANGGLSDWESWLTMTSTSDGYDDNHPRIEASNTSPNVVLPYVRLGHEGGYHTVAPTGVFVSNDQGANFGSSPGIADGLFVTGDIIEQPGTGIWWLTGMNGNQPALYRAHESDLETWMHVGSYADGNYPNWVVYPPAMALNPAKDHRTAVLWNVTGTVGGGDANRIMLDADWRDDPGYPVLEDGFPLQLDASALSPPAVVDMDADGDLEIVFSDIANQIQVLHHDGSPLAGWPVDVNEDLSDGPVAVGDLNGDKFPEVVVGTADGVAHAYDHEGNTLPGWPVTSADVGDATYVSIGALGAPYHRTVVICSGNSLQFRNRSGHAPMGTHGWNFFGGFDFQHPAAIGDIDADGISEVVGAIGQSVFALEMYELTMEFSITATDTVSDAVSLGDLDLDGELEILVPTSAGILDAFDHTGTPLGGNFPHDTGSGEALTSVAMAQIRGGSEPELAFAERTYRVHLLRDDGSVAGGYPTDTQSYWPLEGPPIIGLLEGASGDVVIGDSSGRSWAWDNYGDSLEGWYRVFDWVRLRETPAYGDIDLDGSAEIVFLGGGQVIVVDVNSPLDTASQIWAMDGHDPQRTGCSDCPEDQTTSVEPGSSGVTRVSFAPPAPNPLLGSTVFRYTIPERAVVNLDIYDIRGRRVRRVHREEQSPGIHILIWHGKNDRGESLPSGQYLARLKVTGPGLNQTLTRKITIVK